MKFERKILRDSHGYKVIYVVEGTRNIDLARFVAYLRARGIDFDFSFGSGILAIFLWFDKEMTGLAEIDRKYCAFFAEAKKEDEETEKERIMAFRYLLRDVEYPCLLIWSEDEEDGESEKS